VFDVGDSDLGDPYIVMELLNGRTLGRVLATEQRLSAVQGVQLLLPVADALMTAHAKGIVHRDLKPDNVFLAYEGEQLQPKLLDFGIAKLADEASQNLHLTQTGAVLGSPEYMSPEQARGQDDIDHRTDIWSFCVVLYETLSGVSPFRGANYNSLLRSIVEDEPQSLIDLLAADPPLWEIVQRGLCKDVTRRYATMAELGKALAGWLINQGITEDASGVSLDSKWIARNSTPSAQRAPRASFASLSGVTPNSGVRTAELSLGGAPTVSVEAAEVAIASAPAPKQRSQLWQPRIWLGVALLTLAVGALAMLAPKHQPPALAQTADVPTLASPPAASRPEATPTALVAPPASQAQNTPPAASSHTKTPASKTASPRKSTTGTTPAPSQPSTSAPHSDAQRDLLAPY
jgi:serine/threonine-protein kinase